MKTEQQVIRYIMKSQFDDEDWQKVLAWCKQRFGGGKIHRSLKPLRAITYQQFLDWTDNGFATGDVVEYDNGVGIVGDTRGNTTVLAVYQPLNEELVVNEVEVSTDSLKLADLSIKKKFLSLLREYGYVFSISMGTCVKAWLPEEGDFVIALYHKKKFLGIFHEFDDEGCVFYVFVNDNNVLYPYQLRDYEVDFMLANKTTKQKIIRLLESQGLAWDYQKKEIVSSTAKRLLRNGRYWYMSERFSPTADYDLHRRLDEMRFEAGNYFQNVSECYTFCEMVREARRAMVVGSDTATANTTANAKEEKDKRSTKKNGVKDKEGEEKRKDEAT